MARIKLNDVVKIYPGDVKAVDGFNLEIKDREFVVFVGPSGCGKSTTLRMIAGLEEITHGEIIIGEKLVNGIPPKDRDIAMVFQNYALYPHMTVYKNMAFSLKMRKAPKDEIDSSVRRVAAVLGIDHLLDRKPRALSGGERQRVALGRAMVRDPMAFLLDEPLANLDAKLRADMRAEIIKLHKELKTTFVYVTHDQTEAMTMGDRIVLMDKGVIKQVDTPANIYAHPANLFVAGFIGSPKMNLINAVITPQGAVTATGACIGLRGADLRNDALLPYFGREVTLGIRPEHIHPAQAKRSDTLMPGCSVELVERLGAEAYVHLISGEDKLVSRVAGNIDVSVGDIIDLELAPEMIHLFDKDSTGAITGPPSVQPKMIAQQPDDTVPAGIPREEAV